MSRTDPGLSFSQVPALHGTCAPSPRSGAVDGTSTPLSQHCCPHAFASAHDTQTLQPRVRPQAARHSSGGSERPRGPYPSWTTAPSRSVCSRVEAHDAAVAVAVVAGMAEAAAAAAEAVAVGAAEVAEVAEAVAAACMLPTVPLRRYMLRSACSTSPPPTR